jgi:hypothetical protein
VLFFAVSFSAYAQKLNYNIRPQLTLSTDDCFSLQNLNKKNNSFSLKFKPTYMFSTDLKYQYVAWEPEHDQGFGFSVIPQYDLGKVVSLYAELNYSALSFNSSNDDAASFMFNFGTYLYASRAKVPVYFITGIGIHFKRALLINIGTGIEYRVSNGMSIFSEAILHNGVNTGAEESSLLADPYLSFGFGISLNFKN